MSDDLDEAAMEALQAWYEAVDSGTRPSLATICNGDENLEARVRRILDQDPLQMLAESRAPRAEASTTGLPFERLGEFRLVAPLGQGGAARVFLAEQQTMRRLVALKILRSDVLDPRARLRFEREAVLAGQIEHQSIVPIYGVGEDGGHPFIAMKWLSGPGLDAMEKPVPAEQAARIGSAIARALHEAHACGVIHRDIKPANIILDSGSPVLVDFGLAATRDAETRLSRSGEAYGTIPYMPPELIERGAVHFDGRGDVYSLGATLYELLTGFPPFESTEPATLMKDILFRQPAKLGLEQAHRDLESIILCALEKQPRDRFDSASELADDLDRYLAGQPTRVRPPGFTEKGLRLVRRHPRRTVIAAAVLGTLLTAGLWTASERERRHRSIAGARTAAELALRNGDPSQSIGPIRALRALGADAAADELDRHRLARAAVESLLDEVVGRRGTLSTHRLDNLITELRTTDAEKLEAERASLGLAMVELFSGRHEELAERLDDFEERFGPRRATIAIRAAIEGRPFEASWSGRAEILDHVLAYATLRRVHAPYEQRRAELDRARDFDARNERFAFAHAVDLAETEQHAAAHAVLTLLTRPEEPDSIRNRTLALIEVELGEFAEAEKRLESIPVNQRGPWEAMTLFTSKLRRGDLTAAEALLTEAIERWPNDPQVRSSAGEWEFQRGRVDQAREHLTAVSEMATWAPHVERARAGLLLIKVESWRARLAGLQAQARSSEANMETLQEEEAALLSEHEALAVEAKTLADSCREHLARSRAHFASASLAAYLGQLEKATVLAEKATDTPNGETLPSLLFAKLVALELGSPWDKEPEDFQDMDEEQRRRLESARRTLHRLLDDTAGSEALPMVQRREAESLVLRLAAHAGDAPDVRASLERLGRLEKEQGPHERTLAKDIARARELYGP